jgi:hypothetical protein
MHKPNWSSPWVSSSTNISTEVAATQAGANKQPSSPAHGGVPNNHGSCATHRHLFQKQKGTSLDTVYLKGTVSLWLSAHQVAWLWDLDNVDHIQPINARQTGRQHSTSFTKSSLQLCLGATYYHLVEEDWVICRWAPRPAWPVLSLLQFMHKESVSWCEARTLLLDTDMVDFITDCALSTLDSSPTSPAGTAELHVCIFTSMIQAWHTCQGVNIGLMILCVQDWKILRSVRLMVHKWNVFDYLPLQACQAGPTQLLAS